MSFRVEIEDNAVQAAFARLIRAGEDLTPVMRMVANHLADAAEESFEQERSPLGEAWPALAPATQKARAKSDYDMAQCYSRAATSSGKYWPTGGQWKPSPEPTQSTQQCTSLDPLKRTSQRDPIWAWAQPSSSSSSSSSSRY